MTFEFKKVPHDAKRSTVCAEENCTRSFSIVEAGGNNRFVKIFQTRLNVSNTLSAALYRHEYNLPVNNGGCQEGTINS